MKEKKYWKEKIQNIGNFGKHNLYKSVQDNEINWKKLENGYIVMFSSRSRRKKYNTNPPELKINWKKVRVIALVMLLSVLF